MPNPVALPMQTSRACRGPDTALWPVSIVTGHPVPLCISMYNHECITPSDRTPACLYTLLYNLFKFPAGTLPVTKVFTTTSPSHRVSSCRHAVTPRCHTTLAHRHNIITVTTSPHHVTSHRITSRHVMTCHVDTATPHHTHHIPTCITP